MASIPQPFTLSILANDIINYKGQKYTISNVAAGVDDGKGNITYVLTLTGAPVSTITVSAANCVQSSDQGSSTGVTTWSQSANP